MEFVPTPQFEVPTSVPDLSNRWCVYGQYQIYRDAKSLNNKEVITQTSTVERRVLTGSLHTFPAIHDLFTRHELEWMDNSVGPYNEDTV